MLHMSGRRLIVVLVGLGVLLLSGCTAATTAASSGAPAAAPDGVEVVKIGFMAAATGGAAFLGLPEQDAARMIQAQLADQEFVSADGKPRRVEIVIYDTEGSGDVAIPLTKKLIADDQVAIIVGGTRSPVSLALVPIVQEAKIPYISMASSSEIVEPLAERYWVFKTAQSNRHTAPWQVRYVQELGLTQVASLYVNDAYGEDGRNAIRQAADEAGVEIILEETFESADTDMTAQLTKIKASGAQALLVTGLPPAASIITKQFHELGLDMPLVHNHGIGMKPFIDLAGAENAEGVVFPIGKMVAVDALADDDPQKPVLQQFIRDYEAFTGNPTSTFAGHAWDGVQIALKAIAAMPSGLSLEEQRAFLRDTVETMSFVGTGGKFQMSPEDHVGLSPDDVVLVRITNGEWQYFPPSDW
jgi:branched-chain amino acid transport system substrate-binding protein